MTMCLASAADAWVPRISRQYTDEQIVEAVVAAELNQQVSAERVSRAQAEAAQLVGQGVPLDVAIKRAVAGELRRSILLATIQSATEAVMGYALPGAA
jgi:hypothetical protein